MTGRALRICVLAAAVALIPACRTTSEDVTRWAQTSQGPRKLIAVLTHDKYPLDLRVTAAMTLVGMKPRKGRHVGLQGDGEQPGLVEALVRLPEAARSKLIEGMLPALEAGMRQLPTPASDARHPAEDASIPYKDAAYALLTHDGGTFAQNPNVNQRLRSALTEWASTNFQERLDNASQAFGMQQVLQTLKADGVRKLPALIKPGVEKTDRIAGFVADLGDDAAKEEAAAQLVNVAKTVDSEQWLADNRAYVEGANKVSGQKVDEKQLRAQLVAYQEEELLRTFASMKRLGRKPSVEYLLAFARTPTASTKRRSAALAALQGHLDEHQPSQASALLDLAGMADTPDDVRDLALRRVGEMPRALVVSRLYDFFKAENWKLRWLSAELVLKMSDVSHIDEFMTKMGEAQGLALTEILRYGALIGSLKGNANPRDVALKYAQREHGAAARLSALAYYFAEGTTADLPQLTQYESDFTPIPGCREGAKDCEWKCLTGTGEQRKANDVKTVGQFVEFCLRPAMSARAGAKASPNPGPAPTEQR